MSTSKLKLFRLLGITFQIDLAWMLVFALMAFSLAAQFSKEYPNWSVAHYWIVGIVTCLLFFVSIILHELAHCLVARAAGLPVQSITLFILGGVSHIGKEAQRPGIEFLVSVAGPLASVAISASFAVLHVATRSNFETVAAVAEWLAEINLVLVLFNLIPAFPLDGGRILRSALWGISGDFSKATRIASVVGRTTSVSVLSWRSSIRRCGPVYLRSLDRFDWMVLVDRVAAKPASGGPSGFTRWPHRFGPDGFKLSPHSNRDEPGQT